MNKETLPVEPVQIVERKSHKWPDEIKVWNERRLAWLRHLIEVDGLSAATAAECMKVNRNQVISAAHRYDIKLRGNSEQQRKQHKDRTVPRGAVRSTTVYPVRSKGNVTVMAQMYEPVEPQRLAAFNAAIPHDQRKQLHELENVRWAQGRMVESGDCRWPVGEVGAPDFFFCGDHAEHSYCQFHCNAAMVPSRRKLPDRPHWQRS